MSKKTSAFTLIEVVIALSLSCVVIFGMLQSYRSINIYLDRTRSILEANRKASLLFNLMEQDFSSAFIPLLHKEMPKVQEQSADSEQQPKKDGEKSEEKKPEEKKELTKEDKEKERQKDLETLKTYFMATYNDQESHRHEGRQVYLFKNVTMINTNPLQVYGQRRVRLVRVLYELTFDKENTKGTDMCYQLWRKETTDIDNVKMKVDDLGGQTEKEKLNPIRSHLVADNIKTIYVEYLEKKPKEVEAGAKSEKEEEEDKWLHSWSETKETAAVVPAGVRVFIEFWNKDRTQTQAFNVSFPIFSYPSDRREEDEKADEQKDVSGKDVKKDEKKDDGKTPPAANAGPASPGQPPAQGATPQAPAPNPVGV